MDTYRFVEGKPGDYVFAEEVTLFHDAAHLLLQDDANWISFFILGDDQIVKGLVHFHLQDGIARSHRRSPYGSFLFTQSVASSTIKEFINHVTSRMFQLGATSIQIVGYPEFLFSSLMNELHAGLLECGYEIKLSETSSYITTAGQEFETSIYKAQQRRLRKCVELGFRFVKELPVDIERIYDFISKQRGKKKYELSMSLNQIKKLQQAFPDRFFLFGVYDGDRLIAASLSILEHSTSLYDFYHDHDSEYDAVSPVVFLMKGMYDHCLESGIQFINLGTSNIDGEVNESLLEFKRSLGATTCSKYTYQQNRN